MRFSNKRLLVGNNFPTKIDNINIGTGAYDGKTAYQDAILDMTKKVKSTHKAKRCIRKEAKLDMLYSKIDKLIVISENKKKRKKNYTKKDNAKKYSRR